ncbi:MAG TPA: rubredoxin [Sunxiuqinia sp.]|nr:rubredoxin [Sunxiuqinia sp.]
MKNKQNLVRVLLKGGVVSPDFLLSLLDCASGQGNETVFFGSRQDILFQQNKEGDTDFFEENKVLVKNRQSNEQNIVSSFVCVDVYPSTRWVHAGTYLRVFEHFQHPHQLRVNIVDPRQTLVPLFYGHINFVASAVDNYWHLYINREIEEEPEAWNRLIFTDDLAIVAEALEKIMLSTPNADVIDYFDLLSTELTINTVRAREPLELPDGQFPNYEGFYLMENKAEYWAGFYWRNNQYDIKFLNEVCLLCKQFDIGRIYITPWKTFMIKGIKANQRVYWEELVGRYGINMRHSSFELNWHLPLLNQEALELKRYLVRNFDKRDVRTFGLSFAINPRNAEVFSSVVIDIKTPKLFSLKLKWLTKYDIRFAYDFNPNSHKYINYEQNLAKSGLTEALTQLSKNYYSRLTVKNFNLKTNTPAKTTKKSILHQCPDCLTIYDERYGDPIAGIAPGTSFDQLADDYCCQLCEQSKSQFVEIKVSQVDHEKLKLNA